MSAIKHIKFGGISAPIRFDVNAYCEFEEITKRSLINGFVFMDFSAIRALYYVALKCGFKFENNQGYKKTIEEVGECIDISDKDTLKTLVQCLHKSLGFGIGTDKTEPTENAEEPGE
jgi:hypothetical protein